MRPSEQHVQYLFLGPASWWVNTVDPNAEGGPVFDASKLKFENGVLQPKDGSFVGLSQSKTRISVRYEIERYGHEGVLSVRRIRRKAVNVEISGTLLSVGGAGGAALEQILCGGMGEDIAVDSTVHQVYSITLIADNWRRRTRTSGEANVATFYACYSEGVDLEFDPDTVTKVPVSLKGILPAEGNKLGRRFRYQYTIPD